MGTELEKWAVIERQFINEEISSIELGMRVIAANGEDITAHKLTTLKRRLEHANKVIAEIVDAERT